MAMGERELLSLELFDKLLTVSSDDGNGRHGNLRNKGTKGRVLLYDFEAPTPTSANRTKTYEWATELKRTLPHDDLAARYTSENIKMAQGTYQIKNVVQPVV